VVLDEWFEFGSTGPERSHVLDRAIKLLRAEAQQAAITEARSRLTHEVTCARCGSAFSASMPTARFCSGRCRVAAHRAEQRREKESEIELGDDLRRFP
jgi:hypothetical protein